MSKYIQNKIVVVTGGANGIGFSIANKYIENGAQVVVLIDINENQGKVAEEILSTKYGEGKAQFIKCDVTKDLETTFNIIKDKYKYVDILVNNAGVGGQSVPRRVMEINATAVIEWSLEFFNVMRKDTGGTGGTIINIASVLGYTIEPYAHVYQASKFAVSGFTRSLGHKCMHSKTGVRTICLCPGLTDTNIIKDLMTEVPKTELIAELVQNIKNQTHIKYIIQDPDSVGKAAVEILDRAPSGSMWSIVNGELENVEVEIK